MRSMSLDEHKKVQLEILRSFDDFCDKHNLKYFIAYGTLIGAVRHKGFIPWDDDIDVWMPREDYNRLIKEYKFQNPYRLVDPKEKMARHTFVKIIDTNTIKIEKLVDYRHGYLGVDIDVFPLDGQPENKDEFVVWQKRLKKIYRNCLIKALKNGGGFRRRVVFPFIKFFARSKKWAFKQADRLHSQYPYEKCKYVGTTESAFDTTNDHFDRTWFDEVVYLEFEGYSFKAPKQYDKILTQLYGDYMTPPPEKEQVTHHQNAVYRKE